MSEAPRYGIVTGAAGALGRALAVRLARNGWHLALADVDVRGAEETQRAVRAAGGRGQVEPLNVADPAAWDAMLRQLQEAWPRLDLLVNNAGVAGAGEVGTFPLTDWRWLLDVNLFGTIHGCHACVPWLKLNPRGGHILNISSIAGYASFPFSAAYNVSKAGVLSLSETLHAELAQHDIGVTAVCPGFFPSTLLAKGRTARVELLRAGEELMQHSGYTAEDVAEQAVRAIGKRRLYVVTSPKARTIWRIKRWTPGIFASLLRRWGRRELK